MTDPVLINRFSEIVYNQEWIANAPLIIVLYTIGVGDDRGGRNTQKQRFPEYAAHIDEINQDLFWALNQEEDQTKIAGNNMALAGLEHGVDSCWVSWFEIEKLTELLHLPKGCCPSELLVCGYPEKPRKPTKKKSLEEIVFYNFLR